MNQELSKDQKLYKKIKNNTNLYIELIKLTNLQAFVRQTLLILQLKAVILLICKQNYCLNQKKTISKYYQHEEYKCLYQKI